MPFLTLGYHVMYTRYMCNIVECQSEVMLVCSAVLTVACCILLNLAGCIVPLSRGQPSGGEDATFRLDEWQSIRP